MLHSSPSPIGESDKHGVWVDDCRIGCGQVLRRLVRKSCFEFPGALPTSRRLPGDFCEENQDKGMCIIIVRLLRARSCRGVLLGACHCFVSQRAKKLCCSDSASASGLLFVEVLYLRSSRVLDLPIWKEVQDEVQATNGLEIEFRCQPKRAPKSSCCRRSSSVSE